MNASRDAGADLRCSFCNRSQTDVRKIIASGNGVAICDECVETCSDILADSPGRPSSWDESEPVTGEEDLIPFRCPTCGHHWKIARD